MKTLLVSTFVLVFSLQLSWADENCETKSPSNPSTRIVREVR